MSDAVLLDQLIEALRALPGVGPRSAQRMAFHLLERDRDGGRKLGGILGRAMDEIGHCAHCRTFSETELCALCASDRRDDELLCIVESPSDVVAIEQATRFGGRYFVLGGHLSPLDGIGPNELGLHELSARLNQGLVKEMILATNPTVEGEATAHYLTEMAAAHGVAASRIAHGVPLGGELEYVDGGTLAHAFAGRRRIEENPS